MGNFTACFILVSMSVMLALNFSAVAELEYRGKEIKRLTERIADLEASPVLEWCTKTYLRVEE